MAQASVGPYQILRKIRDGGSSSVYRALDIRDGRTEVALKIWRTQEDGGRASSVASFRKEESLLRRIRHPNIIRLVDANLSASPPYMALEYFESKNLKELILARSPLVTRSGIGIVRKTAEGLAQVHQAGYVHRDIKPENILVSASGELRLIDFALAEAPTRGWRRLVARRRRIEGTRPYMAPEQIRAEPVDPRTDIYSLGVVLFEVLAGRTPFEGSDADDILRRHLHEPPPPLPAGKIPEPLRTEATLVIHRCMEKRPERRFPDMASLAAELERLAPAGTIPSA